MDKYEELELLIRELYGRVAWTHKTHEKQADIFCKRSIVLTWTKIIVSALVSFACIFSVTSDDGWGYFSSILSVILLFINLIFENRDFAKLSEEHRSAASLLLDIRESYLALLFDTKSRDVDIKELRKRRDALQHEFAKICSTLPRTGKKAYIQATEALHQSELTFDDEEIDHILPKKLQKTVK